MDFQEIEVFGMRLVQVLYNSVLFRLMQFKTSQLYVFAVLNSMIAGGSTNTMGGP